MNEQTKVSCSTRLHPLWGRCPSSSHSNLQWCKAGQRVSLTTYCPWATCWLLHIHNYNIFAFKPYFGQIWSILNSYLTVHWTCAKFPAQGVHRLLRLQIRPEISLFRPHIRLLRSLRTNSTLSDLKLALLGLESELRGISPLRPGISPLRPGISPDRSLTSPCRLLIIPLGLQGHKL